MALGFGDVPLEVVFRAKNQMAPGLAQVGAQLKALQAEINSANAGISGLGAGGKGGGAGLLGGAGLPLAIGGGVAVLTAAGAAGRSLVDTYRSQQTALADVKQAYEAVGSSAGYYLDQIQKFIDKNHSYIEDINAVREGFATVTRAGIDQTLVQETVQDAMNISILRHIDFGTALQQVLLGLEGNTRGLKVLGINVKDYGDLTKSATQIQNDDAAAKRKVDEATKNVSKAQRALAEDMQRLHDKGYTTKNDLMHEQDLKGKVKDATQKLKDAQQAYTDTVKKGNDQVKDQRDLLDTIAGKTKNAKGTVDDLSKAQHDLNYQWERLSNQIGPGLLETTARLEGHFADIVGDIVDHNLVRAASDFSDVMGNMPLGPLTTAAQLWGIIANAVERSNQAQSSGHYVGVPGRGGHWVPNPPANSSMQNTGRTSGNVGL